MRTDRGPTAALLLVLAIALMSGLDAGMKGLMTSAPIPTAVFLRYVAALLVLIPVFAARPQPLTRARLLGNGVRGVLNAVTALLFFVAIARLPLALVIAIAFLAPLFIALFAWLILGERIGGRTWIGIVGGLVGIGVILSGQLEPDRDSGDVVAFAAAILGSAGYALSAVLIRHRSVVDTAITIVAIQTMISAVLLAPLAIAAWQPLSPADWLLALLVGLLGATGQLCLAAGYARGEAARLGIIEYTALLWAALFGFVLFGEVPRIGTALGAIIIVAACVFGVRPPRPRSPNGDDRVPVGGPVAIEVAPTLSTRVFEPARKLPAPTRATS